MSDDLLDVMAVLLAVLLVSALAVIAAGVAGFLFRAFMWAAGL